MSPLHGQGLPTSWRRIRGIEAYPRVTQADEVDVRAVTGNLLAALVCQVATCTTAEEALALLAPDGDEQPFDILRHTLAGMGGSLPLEIAARRHGRLGPDLGIEPFVGANLVHRLLVPSRCGLAGQSFLVTLWRTLAIDVGLVFRLPVRRADRRFLTRRLPLGMLDRTLPQMLRQARLRPDATARHGCDIAVLSPSHR